jgi:orotidine-5'-phosphate decarboxylase
MNLAPKDRIIFPLDVPSIEEAIHFVHLLKDHVGCFKVGLELFVTAGPEILKIIRESGGARIFLDLKFHDIPETVKKACLAANRHGVTFVTVHTNGGRALLKAAVYGMQGSGTNVLAVTALTSTGQSDLSDLGYTQGLSIHDLVLSRARMAKEAGCDGIVCSGHETKAIKTTLGNDFIVVNPGIRPKWEVSQDDQKRIVTPSEAIKNGADYIVIGRPIRLAEDPVKATLKIIEEISLT